MSHRISPSRNITLNYGTFADDGSIDVRPAYDLWVMDGASVARALAHLEELLHGEILAEMRASRQATSKVREIA